MTQNRNEKRDARFVQSLTGAPYTTCLKHLRTFADDNAKQTYIDGIEAVVTEGKEGTKERPLCLVCFTPHDWRECAGL